MNIKRRFLKTLCMYLIVTGCMAFLSACQEKVIQDDLEDNNEATEQSEEELGEVTYENGSYLEMISTNQAAYQPGEPVLFNLQLAEEGLEGKLLIEYKHLAEKVAEEEIELNGSSEMEWEWTPNDEDFTGYMVEVYLQNNDQVVDQLNIAVDVSSEWTKFPRFGYLADYGPMSEEEQIKVIERLNRFHINSIQFYDWKDKHHVPLKLEDGEVALSWKDIANRPVSLLTVEKYIELAHERNMKAMSYNLLFGANEHYEEDGVNKDWTLFKDPEQQEPDMHPLPDDWKSSIYLMDPSNQEWQTYILDKHKELFTHLNFDGWHVDQLGHRGALWNGDGEAVDLVETYGPFMDRAKEELNVYLGLNSVSMYGAEEIAQSNVDYVYVEAWDQRNYQDLKDVVDQHWNWTNQELNLTFAAYMNFDLAGEGVQNVFNTPGVLFTDAVIFAAGGSHIELGENMLGREYFPDKTLSIPDELEYQLIRYYDFLVAYQNILRDGVEEVEKDVRSVDVQIMERPVLSTVWSFAKQKDDKEILHFINFTDAISLEWKDSMGTQTEPDLKEDISVTVDAEQKVTKVWLASPDQAEGSAIALEFNQDGEELNFTMPNLKYWNMVVIEY